MKRSLSAFVAVSVFTSVGCSVPKEAGFPDVAREVEPRTGHKIFWNQGGEADSEVRRVVREMLRHPLAPAEAVQIALLNNKNLQATYEDLMIAQADLVQAGLLKNPVLSGHMHFADSGEILPEIGVEQDFLSLLLIPARKRVASAAFEAAKLRVAHEVVDLAYEVREAYFTLQGALQVVSMRQTILESAEASLDLARRLHEAGNLADVNLAEEEALAAEVRLELSRSHTAVVAAREKATRLMGLWGLDAGWSVGARLPDLPAADPALEHVESAAIAQRLDIASAREDMQARSHAVAMAKDWWWLGSASVDGHYEEVPGGTFGGPGASVEVPLFDQGQAQIARLEAELRKSRDRLLALAVEIRSEVREARARVEAARDLASYYRTSVIPLREKLVALKLERYNAMLIGAFEVLVAKQNEVNAYREYIEAVRDYWIARSSLDRAAGGRLTQPPPSNRERR